MDASMNMQGVAVQQRYGRSILASLHAVWSVAGIVGALASVAVAGRIPLGAHLGAMGVAGALLALLIGPGLLKRDEVRSVATGGGQAKVPWKPVLAIGVAMMFMYIADSSTANWHGPYLLKVLHSTESVAPWAYFFYQGMQVIGRSGADRLGERFGSVRTVVVGAIVGTAGLGIVVAAHSPWVGIAGFGVLGLGLCAIVPQSFTAAARLDPDNTGVAIARVNLFNYAGFVLGAPLVGLVGNLRLGFAIPLVLVLGIVPFAGAFRSAVGRRVGAPA